MWLAISVALTSCGDGAAPPAKVERGSAPVDQVALDRAERCLSVGRIEEATVLAARLVHEAPSDWRVHDLVARLRLRQSILLGQQGLDAQATEEAAAATAAYRHALALAPDVAGLHQSAGDTATRAGELDFAQQCYERCLALDPQNVRALLCLSQLIETTDRAQAVELLTQAIALDRSIPEGYAALAVIRAKQGDRDAALSALETAIELDRASLVVRLAQARVFRIIGDPQAGVEVLAALSPEAQQDESIAWELSACWSALGRHDQVIDVWAGLVAGHPNRWDRWKWAIRALEAARRAGDEPQAAAMAELARRSGAPEEAVRDALHTTATQVDNP